MLIEELKSLKRDTEIRKLLLFGITNQPSYTEYYHIIDDQKLNAEHMQYTDDIEIYVMEE